MTTSPKMMPMLARGKHRNPRRGACFMELASYLAGEKWTDRPSCTDADLAHLARLVNDLTSDDARPILAQMVPSIIGQVGLGAGFQDELALITAEAALPIVALSHQRAIAVGLLRILGQTGDYRSQAHSPLPERARATLEDHGALKRWAQDFSQQRRFIAPDSSPASSIIEIAVCAIAKACVPNPDDLLRNLLSTCIRWAHHCTGAHPAQFPVLEPSDWVSVVRSA